MDNYAKIVCKAQIENEIMIRCMVAVFVSELNPTLDELTEVKTIMSEAVVNAIIHGYENRADGQIQIEMILEGQQLEIIVKDEGCGISDLSKARQPLYTTKPELERSGMGMTIMESLSDHFEIQSELGKGTKIKMIKNFRGHQ